MAAAGCALPDCARRRDGIGADDRIGAEQHGMLPSKDACWVAGTSPSGDLAQAAERHDRIAALRSKIATLPSASGSSALRRRRSRCADRHGRYCRRRRPNWPRRASAPLAGAGARRRPGLRIQIDRVFQAGPGEDGDPAEPLGAGEDRHDLLLDQMAQLRLGQRLGGDGVLHRRLHIGMLDDGDDVGDRGKAGPDGGDDRLDVLQIGLRIAAGSKSSSISTAP